MIDQALIKKSYICSYSRKSQEDKTRQIHSINDQIAINKDTAKRHDIHIPKANLFEEEQSASKPGRPIFNTLLQRIEQNEHTILFCWHYSRLSRNPLDSGRVEWLRQQGKLTIVTPNQVFDQHTNAVLAGVEGGSSSQYSVDLSRTVRGRLQLKRERGVPSGVASPGYINAGEEKGDKWWETDDGTPNRFVLIQQALKQVLDGIEPMEALRTLNDLWGFRTIKRKKLGGNPIAKQTWYKMLRDPIYAGSFISKGKWYKVNHPKFRAMITEDEYWKLQAMLGKKGRTRPKLHDKEQAAFLKMITCGECGATMSRDRKRYVRCVCKTKYAAQHREVCPNCGQHESLVPEERKHSYDYYFCDRAKKKKCSQPIIHTKDIEAQITDVLNNVTIPPEFVEIALDYLESTNDEELNTQEATLGSLQYAYDAKQKELNRLSRAYVGGSYEYEGGEEYYQQENQRLIAEKNKLKKSIDDFDIMADDWRGKTESGYRYCQEALAAFTETEADYRTKKDILFSLCSKVTVKGKRLILELEPPFEFIRKKLDEVKDKYEVTEPEKIAELLNGKANKTLADAIKTTWRYSLYKIRTFFETNPDEE